MIVTEVADYPGYRKVLPWGLRRLRVGLDEICIVEKNCALEVRPGFEIEGILVLEGALYVMQDGE